MNDTAKGPLAGYLFQLEKALSMLSGLNANEYLSIEKIDDVAIHNGDTILHVLQAKHSLSLTNSSYEDTSKDLWRTLQLWIEKLEANIVTNETKFICCTNKTINKDSLLIAIKDVQFENVIKRIKDIQKAEKDKRRKSDKSGSHIKAILGMIAYVLNHLSEFEIIKNNIEIQDNSSNKDDFYNNLNLGSAQIDYTRKEKIFQEFFGWISDRCIYLWKQGTDAIISKKDFDEKCFQIQSNPTIINAIFRTKNELNALYKLDEQIIDNMKNELYIRQIEDIDRKKEAKEQIIKDAIIDFIYHHNELKFIIDQGNYTQTDFIEFIETCFLHWRDVSNSIILYDSEKYSEENKNELAIRVFDAIMQSTKEKFEDYFEFTSNNMYFKKGCYLDLSNKPKIGWHPDWQEKYGK